MFVDGCVGFDVLDACKRVKCFPSRLLMGDGSV